MRSWRRPQERLVDVSRWGALDWEGGVCEDGWIVQRCVDAGDADDELGQSCWFL